MKDSMLRSLKLSAIAVFTAIFFLYFFSQSAFYYRLQVKEDLFFIQQMIREIHPLYKYKDLSEYEAFKYWLENGLNKSLVLAESVDSLEDANALIQFYVKGFNDIHLSASSYETCFGCFTIGSSRINISKSSNNPILWSGFSLSRNQKKLVVDSVADTWSSALPNVGYELVSCDAIPIDSILRDFSKFNLRDSHSTSQYKNIIKAITYRGIPGIHLFDRIDWKNCTFKDTISGKTIEIDMVWRLLSSEEYKKKFPINSIGFSSNELGGYLKVPTFSYFLFKHPQFSKVIRDIANFDNSKSLVIDLRGNSGGSIFTIYPLLKSLLGKDIYESKSLKENLSFKVRNTKFLRKFLLERITDKPSSAQSMLAKIFYEKLSENSNAEFLNIFIDPYRLDEIINLNYVPKTKRKFSGAVLLVIDGNCTSACLTFIESLKGYENVTVFGETTFSDTIFSQPVFITTPNQIQISIPSAVVFRRTRSSYEKIHPSILFPGDISNDDELVSFIKNYLIRF